MNTTPTFTKKREGKDSGKIWPTGNFARCLKNLLKQMAIDWFRDTTATYGNFREQLTALKENDKLLKKREKSTKARRTS